MSKTLLSFALAMSVSAVAQAFSTKPITFVVPFAAGGPTDTAARQLAEAMRKHLDNATIVVYNAPPAPVAPLEPTG